MYGSKYMMRMKKTLLYILGIVALASCSDEVVDTTDYLNGKEKTPIVVKTNIYANNKVTRAVDGQWEKNDVFMAYIKHVTTTGTSPKLVYSGEVTGSGIGPRLAGFKINSLTDNHKNIADNYTEHTETSVLETTDAEGLYWDDFSNSTAAATDLRTENHALMSYYGYCYNGSPAYGETDSHISTNLDEEHGTLGWTVATDQSTGFKTSDLLFSPTQSPVAYNHGTNNTINGRDRVLEIPYSHAMSKITVVIECEDGFVDTKNNFTNTSVKLQDMNTVATITGPTASVKPILGDDNVNVKNVTMQPITEGATNMKKSFSALIVPTVMKASKTLAKINDVDGNNYDISLTDAVLKTSTGNAWSTKLAAYNAEAVTPNTNTTNTYDAANGGITLPGVHYMITVTIKKQEIKVQATIQDWTAVSATGVGEIQFSTDVKTIITDPAIDDTNISGMEAAFDLYKKTTDVDAQYGVTRATTCTWNSTTKIWENTPTIYWQNKDDKEYFRALSPVNSTTAMENGKDVLWGTTSKHTGKDINDTDYTYNEGDPINPRTQNVPLIFRHAMSMITVNLEDANASIEDDEAKLNLAGAKIEFINLATTGTLDLHTGAITKGGITDGQAMFNTDYYAANDPTTPDAKTPQVKDYAVIPQEIADNVRIQITLADGTKYSAQLNLCQDTSNAAVDKWESGKHYTYNIKLTKETILFRALVKEWDKKETSGTATFEWD